MDMSDHDVQVSRGLTWGEATRMVTQRWKLETNRCSLVSIQASYYPWSPHKSQGNLLKVCIRSYHIPAYIPSILRAKHKPRDCDTHITHSSLPSPTSVMSHPTTTPLHCLIEYTYRSYSSTAESPCQEQTVVNQHSFQGCPQLWL